jgi:putative flippase GtrA
MSEWTRFLRFNAVAAMGLAVQLATLWLLLRLGLHYAPATAAAVAAAVAHNLAWHVSWTWRDRAPRGPRRAVAMLKLAAGQGGVSLAGNLALMPVFVTLLHLPPLLANVLAVAACGLGNLCWGRVCFPQVRTERGRVCFPQVSRID